MGVRGTAAHVSSGSVAQASEGYATACERDGLRAPGRVICNGQRRVSYSGSALRGLERNADAATRPCRQGTSARVGLKKICSISSGDGNAGDRQRGRAYVG